MYEGPFMVIDGWKVSDNYRDILEVLGSDQEVAKLTIIDGPNVVINLRPDVLHITNSCGAIYTGLAETQMIEIRCEPELSLDFWNCIRHIPFKHINVCRRIPLECLPEIQKISIASNQQEYNCRLIADHIPHIKLIISDQPLDVDTIIGIAMGLRNNPGRTLTITCNVRRQNVLIDILNTLLRFSVSLEVLVLKFKGCITSGSLLMHALLGVDTLDLLLPKSVASVRTILGHGRYRRISVMTSTSGYKKNTPTEIIEYKPKSRK